MTHWKAVTGLQLDLNGEPFAWIQSNKVTLPTRAANRIW